MPIPSETPVVVDPALEYFLIPSRLLPVEKRTKKLQFYFATALKFGPEKSKSLMRLHQEISAAAQIKIQEYLKTYKTTGREKIKANLQIIMRFINLINNKDFVSDLKLKYLPAALRNLGGNDTAIKQVILAVYLSVKDITSILNTLNRFIHQRQTTIPS